LFVTALLLLVSCAQSQPKAAVSNAHLLRASDLGEGWLAGPPPTQDPGPQDCPGSVEGTGAVWDAGVTFVRPSSPFFQVTEQLISADEQQAFAYRDSYAQEVPQCEPKVVAVAGVSDAVSVGFSGPILTEFKDQPGLVTHGFTSDPPGRHTSGTFSTEHETVSSSWQCTATKPYFGVPWRLRGTVRASWRSPRVGPAGVRGSCR
jgi:hypothetical protein